MITRPCPLCGKNDFQVIYSPNHRITLAMRSNYAYQRPGLAGPLVRCKACGFNFINPIEMDDLLFIDGPALGDRPERLLESADLQDLQDRPEQQVIDAYLREYPAKRLNAQDALGHLEKYTQPAGRLLELGSYCGIFLSEASAHGWDCTGIEPQVLMAIYARASFGLNIITGTLQPGAFPPASFDAAVAFQMLEHVVDPRWELEKIHTILKPGGVVGIEVPSIAAPLVRLLGPRHRHFVQDHVSFFTPRTLVRMVESTGFQVLETYYPTRILRMEHILLLMERYTGQKAGYYLRLAVNRAGFANKNISINLRDIVMVIARKL